MNNLGRYQCNFPMYSDKSPGPYYIVANTYEGYVAVARDLGLDAGNRKQCSPVLNPGDVWRLGSADIILAHDPLVSELRDEITFLARYERGFEWYVGGPPDWFIFLDRIQGLTEFAVFETTNPKTGAPVETRFTMAYVRDQLSGWLSERMLHAGQYADSSSRWLNPTEPFIMESITK